MRHILLCGIIFFFAITSVCAQQKDTFTVNVKVVNIESIDYYTVISAITIPAGNRITILSPLDEKNGIVEYCSDSIEIKRGQNCSFCLKRITRIKTGEDSYYIVNLRGFYYGEKQLLKPGELPYKALNAKGIFMFNCALQD